MEYLLASDQDLSITCGIRVREPMSSRRSPSLSPPSLAPATVQRRSTAHPRYIGDEGGDGSHQVMVAGSSITYQWVGSCHCACESWSARTLCGDRSYRSRAVMISVKIGWWLLEFVKFVSNNSFLQCFSQEVDSISLVLNNLSTHICTLDLAQTVLVFWVSDQKAARKSKYYIANMRKVSILLNQQQHQLEACHPVALGTNDINSI